MKHDNEMEYVYNLKQGSKEHTEYFSSLQKPPSYKRMVWRRKCYNKLVDLINSLFKMR